MFRSYLTIALRNLWRNKLFSAINIGGLGIGMAVSFTLLLYVIFQFSFDKFHANADNIYAVVGGEHGGAGMPVPLAEVLPKEIPEVKAAARTTFFRPYLLQAGESALKLSGGFVDPQFLDIFSFPLIKGDVRSLKEKNVIVLTESTAHKLFKDQDPIGKIVKLDAKDPLVVTAVISDPPPNSTIQFEFLSSWSLLMANESWMLDAGWYNFCVFTYALLYPDANAAAANNKIKHLLAKKGGSNDFTLFLHPLKDWKLYEKIRDGKIIGGRIETVRLFIMLALGILLIACVNFMNLSTAQAERRAREVGVRKAIGARRSSLVAQFFGESLILVLVANVLAFALILLFLPAFNNFLSASLDLLSAPFFFWVCMVFLLLLTAIISGSYPALYLSGFQPIKVLKGRVNVVKGAFRPRQLLVVLQFGLAVVLIIVTIVIYRQLNYIQNRPMGYDPKGLVDVMLEGKVYDNFETFRQASIASGAAVDAAIVSSSIASSGSSVFGLKWPGMEEGEEKKSFGIIAATAHFSNTFSIPLKEGRDFRSDADSMSIMLNEAAVKAMRLKEPMGQEIILNGEKRIVTGILKDFVWTTSYQPVEPMVFSYKSSWRSNITFKLNPTLSVKACMDRLERVYHQLNPDYPFKYSFVDDDYKRKYDYERFMGTLTNIFASLAIIISCFGLLGLSVFAAAQRTKEIGVRKVMGAGVHQVTLLLTKDFLKPVLVAIVLGSPIAAYIMNDWLQRYTYRVGMDWWMFALAGALTVFIAVLTVSVQSIKAATMNPVKSLRSE